MASRNTSLHRRTNEQWLNDLRGTVGEEAQILAYKDMGRYVWKCAYNLLVGRAHEYPALADMSDDRVRDLAEDFTQQTLEKIACNEGALLDNFRGESTFTYWVAMITNNIVRSELRKSRYRNEINMNLTGQDDGAEERDPYERMIGTIQALIGEQNSPEEILAEIQTRRERLLALARCLEDRPQRERLAIWVQEVEGWTGHEIADWLGMTRNAAYQLLRVTRLKLRECLERRGVS